MENLKIEIGKPAEIKLENIYINSNIFDCYRQFDYILFKFIESIKPISKKHKLLANSNYLENLSNFYNQDTITIDELFFILKEIVRGFNIITYSNSFNMNDISTTINDKSIVINIENFKFLKFLNIKEVEEYFASMPAQQARLSQFSTPIA